VEAFEEVGQALTDGGQRVVDPVDREVELLGERRSSRSHHLRR